MDNKTGVCVCLCVRAYMRAVRACTCVCARACEWQLVKDNFLHNEIHLASHLHLQHVSHLSVYLTFGGLIIKMGYDSKDNPWEVRPPCPLQASPKVLPSHLASIPSGVGGWATQNS